MAAVALLGQDAGHSDTSRGSGHTRATAGNGGSVVSKARTGASRAPGWLLVAHDKGGSEGGGGGGGGGGAVN